MDDTKQLTMDQLAERLVALELRWAAMPGGGVDDRLRA
jgi:hypothetical protein